MAYSRQLKIALSSDILQSLSHVCVRKGAGVFTKWNERLFFPIEAANRGHWMHCGLQMIFLKSLFKREHSSAHASITCFFVIARMYPQLAYNFRSYSFLTFQIGR